jgi:5-methylcytosine-specific restriction protein A
MLSACFLLLALVFVVFALVGTGSDRATHAAYALLRTGNHLFEPERGDEDQVRSRATPRRPGAKVERRATPLTKKRVGEKYGWTCACGCGRKLSFDYHVDHIVPLWKGGNNAETNLQPLNPRCHAFKTSLENQVL